MTAGDSSNEKSSGVTPADTVVRFPYSRLTPVHRSSDPGEQPIFGNFAKDLGAPAEQTTGHWCSRCRRIWFGYMLEVACPACGNRHG